MVCVKQKNYVFLMAYYEKPEIFNLHDVNYWYDGIKCFGAEHIKVKK